MSQSDSQKIRLSIAGMKCSGCVGSVEKSLQAVQGVESVSVNFADHSALVIGTASDDALKKAVASVGFKAAVMSGLEDLSAQEDAELIQAKSLLNKAIIAGIFGIPLMLAGFFGVLPKVELSIFWVSVALITALVMSYSGGHFFKGALSSARLLQFNMDTLIALGTGSAWVYSFLAIILPNLLSGNVHVYFEASIIILAFLNFGTALEIKARGKTSEVIRELIGLQPKTATVLRDGILSDAPIETVGLGETIQVKPGEKIAVDGEIIDGFSTIDESMLSGESMPVDKTIGDKVVAGTINLSGSFLFTATNIGQDTVLAQIIKSVRQAQSIKPKLAKLADKIAGIFVPVVLVLSVLTFIVWSVVLPDNINHAFVTAMTILVISCPCALGLATPISVMVAVGRAAKLGVLIRNGDSLQTAKDISYLLLDKTGTITEGKPSVVSILSSDLYDKKMVLQIAASVEQYSEHPLASAILAENQNPVLKISDFEALTGFGVTANWDGKIIYFGNQDLMTVQNIDYSDFKVNIESLSNQGQTAMLLAVDGKIAGVIGVADTIKQDSKKAIQKIQQAGIKVMMLTGDNPQTAQAIGSLVGVDDIKAGVRPDDKADIVKQLKKSGEIVGMVGDGVNDASALVSADVGFAIGTGTDIAIESADMVISKGSLTKVLKAIQLSKATTKNIKQNLFGAFIYNIIAIPIAGGILYPSFGILLNPMIAGLAMALSSVTVVSNANRLRFFH